MKRENVVCAVMDWADKLIDAWFPCSVRPAVKVMLKANQHKLLGVIDLFTDANGNILINELIDEYAKLIPVDGIQISAVDLFGDNLITRNISIKILEQSDIEELKHLIMNYK